MGLPFRNLVLAPALAVLLLPGPAPAEVRSRCQGTLLETRGSAELDRPIHRLTTTLTLTAEGPRSETALTQLQERLSLVRSALKALMVEDLRVTSPSTWTRADEPGRPAVVIASLRLSGRLEPDQLQPLILRAGTLPGVSLGPVTGDSDPAEAAEARRRLFGAAYRDAFTQARDLAVVIGRRRLQPLEVQVEGGQLRPVPLRALEAQAAARFDPAELPVPRDRITLLVRFCAG